MEEKLYVYESVELETVLTATDLKSGAQIEQSYSSQLRLYYGKNTTRCKNGNDRKESPLLE